MKKWFSYKKNVYKFRKHSNKNLNRNIRIKIFKGKHLKYLIIAIKNVKGTVKW